MNKIKAFWQLSGQVTDAFVVILNGLLGSKTGLVVAFIVPLAVIPLPQGVKTIENILSSNWLQLWALFVLGIITKNTNHKVNRVHKHLGLSD